LWNFWYNRLELIVTDLSQNQNDKFMWTNGGSTYQPADFMMPYVLRVWKIISTYVPHPFHFVDKRNHGFRWRTSYGIVLPETKTRNNNCKGHTCMHVPTYARTRGPNRVASLKKTVWKLSRVRACLFTPMDYIIWIIFGELYNLDYIIWNKHLLTCLWIIIIQGVRLYNLGK
jgi:hypothetical protein